MGNAKYMLATQGAAVMLIGTPELARRIFHWHSRYVSAPDNNTPAAEICTFDDVENADHNDSDGHDNSHVLACLRGDLKNKLDLVSWRISGLSSLDQLQSCPALQRLDNANNGDMEVENAEVRLLVHTGAILRQLTGSYSHFGRVEVLSRFYSVFMRVHAYMLLEYDPRYLYLYLLDGGCVFCVGGALMLGLRALNNGFLCSKVLEKEQRCGWILGRPVGSDSGEDETKFKFDFDDVDFPNMVSCS